MLPFRTLKFHFHSSISMERVDVLKIINLPPSETAKMAENNKSTALRKWPK